MGGGIVAFYLFTFTFLLSFALLYFGQARKKVSLR